MKRSHSFDIYSPPLSSLKAFSTRPVCFSAQARYCLKASKASLFFRRSQQRRYREASSVKEIQYLYPLAVGGRGPCRSEWTSSKGRERREAGWGKGLRVCFPSMQAGQTGSEPAAGTLGSERSETKLCSTKDLRRAGLM